MTEHVAPLLYTLFAWWASTVLILYADGLPRWTYRWSLGGTTVLMGIAWWGLAVTASDVRLTGAYLAFTCALVIWAWLEMSFLMGVVTGPRRTPCPPGSRGWQRAGHAVMAVLYHELALLAAGAAVLWVSWDAPNPVGAWTFLTLWALRLAAKLNVFLGARNLNEHFLPEATRYLASYFRQRPMNALYPVLLLTSSLTTVWAGAQALSPDTTGFHAAAWTFVATLLALGWLELVLLMLPLPTGALWRWGLRSRETPAALIKG